MRISPRVISSAAAIALTCAVTAAAYFYKSRSAEINEVMVFCKLQFNAYGCFDKLMSYVDATKKSICVCMPGIQNPAIQGRLVKVMKERNIKVRIIVDYSSFDPTDFLLKELIELGAEIKCYNDPMRHLQLKFCLIDDKVLLTGTLNWGNDRSSDHWNYVYITNKNQLVNPIRKQFKHMWNYWNDSTVGEDTVEDSESPTQDHESQIIHHQSHTADCERNKEDHQSHTADSVINKTDHQSHTADRKSYAEVQNKSNETLVLNPVTNISEYIQDSQTFRETVSTPEVYIK